jgi:hypothetical protein
MPKKLYFKAIHGFDAEDYVPIEADELEKAIYAHMTGSKAVFANGSISGNIITVVQPDYHRAMGWNQGYKLGADDFAELRQYGVDTSHQKFMAKTQEKVGYLVSKGRQNEIGKNVPIPELDKKRPNDIDDGVKMLANKFQV